MNKYRSSLGDRYKGVSLEEKRTVVGQTFKAYNEVIEGDIPSSKRSLRNVTSLLGPTSYVDSLVEHMDRGAIREAKEGLSHLIDHMIKNVKPSNISEEW